MVVGVEPLGHVEGGGTVHAPSHGEHALVAGREVAVSLGHRAEKLSPGGKVHKKTADKITEVLVICHWYY